MILIEWLSRFVNVKLNPDILSPMITRAPAGTNVVIKLPEGFEMKLLEETLRQDAIEFAKADLHWRETNGKNRSVEIDKVNKEVGIPLGSPYCKSALWVRVIDAVCKRRGLINPVPKDGSSQSMLWQAPKEFLKVPSAYTPKPGDVGIMTKETTKALGHIYMVTEALSSERHKTIEYNTNSGGSRDGDGCHELERSIKGSPSKKLTAYCDWISWVLKENEKS